ncbi:MAG: hypothetical protein ACSHYB_14510 [Roseibacillus sp.]
MKSNYSKSVTSVVLATASAAMLQGQTTLIDATFDAVANDTNEDFTLLTNNQSFTTGGTWDQATGLLSRGTHLSSTSSAVSDLTIDVPSLGSDSLELTFVVESADPGRSNGIFFGLQAGQAGDDMGPNLWNNLGPSFGFGVRGTNSNGTTAPAYKTVTGGKTWSPAFTTVDQASFGDGCTVVLTISATNWNIDFTGLEDAGGNAVTGGAGIWSDVNFDFSDFVSTMRVVASTQGGAGSIDLASVKVVQIPNTDTDMDGMPDAYELVNNLNPNDAADASLDNDTNGGPDGLTNLQEFNSNTNPQDSDSDDDGLLDGEEVVLPGSNNLNPFQSDQPGTVATSAPGLQTDPLNPDSDGDGLTDFEEIDGSNGFVTNPLTDDTDDDFLLDAFEISNSLDPTDNGDIDPDNGDLGDPDMDLLDNFGEQQFGTDPNDSDSDDDTLLDGQEFDLTNPLSPVLITDPLNPDTDGDNLSDATEVNGGVSDPALADTDDDGFYDSVEIDAGSDPDDVASVPTLASITWTVSALASQYNLITNGPLLFAENYGGIATTVNGIPFEATVDDIGTNATDNTVTLITISTGPGTTNIGTFYDDEDPALSPLIESSWTGAPAGGAQPRVAIFGLTPGLPYVIQIGRADDRNGGTLVNRFYTIDGVGGEVAADPVGATNSIYGGSANPAILFTGSFVATESVQVFDVRQFNAGQDPSGNGANILNFMQVRQTDDLTTSGPPADIAVVSCSFNGTAFDITFENLDPTASYQLVRSDNLQDGFPSTVDGPRVAGAATASFSDPSATNPEAFYRLEELPN